MIYFLNGTSPNSQFPDVERAEKYPNGLLAVGGDLSVERLLNAYRNGIFPWYSPNDPILWWSPNPRLVLFPHKLHISHSLRKTLKRGLMTVTIDQVFNKVIRACANVNRNNDGIWLVEEMIEAYQRLHELSFAHSIEVWEQDNLVGGLYGVNVGQVFCGESMFSYRNDASKVALVHLVQALPNWNCKLIDCQVSSEHLLNMGAEEIPRAEFIKFIDLM